MSIGMKMDRGIMYRSAVAAVPTESKMPRKNRTPEVSIFFRAAGAIKS
jgi:hypothetical protein